MMKYLLLIFFQLGEIYFSTAQVKFPQEKIDESLRNAANHFVDVQTIGSSSNVKLHGSPANFFKRFPYDQPIKIALSQNDLRDADTIVVGAIPHDTLVITGTWFNDGPVYVFNDGVLIFQDAQATINGDLAVVNSGKVFSMNSSLYFPQQYFYQRNLIAANNAEIQFKNSSLNYSGLSHSLAITDSALVQYENVNVIGFTTTGMYRQGSFVIDTCNLVGEIVVTDESNVSISNSDTVLLWHQFPEGSVIHRSFPDGTVIADYSFTPNSNGVSGIDYSINLTNCTNVLWGLMPVNGSDVTIDSSQLRAIGAWFTHDDVANVSGLVDGSYYESSSNLFSDRNLQLNQTSVTTWSIYPMDTSNVTLTSCILGEVGSEQHSLVSAQNIFVDGTGGYLWATDQSFLSVGFSALTCTARSEGNGILLVGYSGITNGAPEATGNSILLLIQDAFIQSPEIFDGSEVWVMNIGNPVSALVDSSLQINGSAYINRTAISVLPTFDHYQLFYQVLGSLIWQAIGPEENVSVNNDLLATWNTHGLTPGLYNLNLVMKDNYGDSAVATSVINLLPDFTGVPQIEEQSSMEIFPNPADKEIFIDGDLRSFNSITIFNVQGQKVEEFLPEKNEEQTTLSTRELTSGLYSAVFESASGIVSKSFVVQH